MLKERALPTFDVYQILEDGDEKFVTRCYNVLPIDVAKLLAKEENLTKDEWQILIDDSILFSYNFYDFKNFERYRIQLFQ